MNRARATATSIVVVFAAMVVVISVLHYPTLGTLLAVPLAALLGYLAYLTRDSAGR